MVYIYVFMSQTLYFVSLTLFSMGFFGTAQGWEGGGGGGAKMPHIPKICKISYKDETLHNYIWPK